MNLREKTDRELVGQLIHNDEAAFGELYIRYKDKLYFFSLYLLKSADESNDIVQEVFTRLWESRSFLRPELSFSSFLYTMTRNRILNYFRDMDIDAKVKQIIAAEKVTEEETIDSELIYSEYQKIFREAIDKLPPQRKRIFSLSRIENKSHKEIAEELGISVNTVQEHISAALSFIKLYFTQHTDISMGVLFATFFF